MGTTVAQIKRAEALGGCWSNCVHCGKMVVFVRVAGRMVIHPATPCACPKPSGQLTLPLG